jgi:hypothetical protein
MVIFTRVLNRDGIRVNNPLIDHDSSMTVRTKPPIVREIRGRAGRLIPETAMLRKIG